MKIHARLLHGLAIVLWAGSLGACGPTDRDRGIQDSGTTDGGPGDAGTEDAPPNDVEVPRDASGDSVSPGCTPTPGEEVGRVSCDDFELAVTLDSTGPGTVSLTGRLFSFGSAGSCLTVEEVEVLAGGETVGMLSGVGAVAESSHGTLLATGASSPEMTQHCQSATNRFGGFGFLVRGRMDGGTFEARCADADSGYRWPPALRVTCHENVDQAPFWSNYAEVSTFEGISTSTSFDITVPHGAGGALLSVDSEITIYPGTYMAVDDEPLILTGSTSVFESDAPVPGTHTSVHIEVDGDPLTERYCPIPSTTPDLDEDPPPVMLVRFKGTGERGAYSTEAYINSCSRFTFSP